MKTFLQKIKENVFNYIYKHKLLPVDYDFHIKGIELVAKTKNEEFLCDDTMGLVGLIPLTLVFTDTQPKFKIVQSIYVRKNGENLVKISLKKSAISYPGFVFYDIISSNNFNRHFYQRINDWLVFWMKNRLQKQFNLTIDPQNIIKLTDFYEYPRLVYVVSYKANQQTYAFPIDAIAILPNQKVLVSIRKSSRANQALQASNQFNLSNVPLQEYLEVYALGDSSRNITDFSTKFIEFEKGVYPMYANEVRNLTIENFIEVGKHNCYICHCEEYSIFNAAGKLAHVPWYKVA